MSDLLQARVDAEARALALKLDLLVLRGEWLDGLVSRDATIRRIRVVAAQHRLPVWRVEQWVFG